MEVVAVKKTDLMPWLSSLSESQEKLKPISNFELLRKKKHLCNVNQKLKACGTSFKTVNLRSKKSNTSV